MSAQDVLDYIDGVRLEVGRNWDRYPQDEPSLDRVARAWWEETGRDRLLFTKLWLRVFGPITERTQP